MSETIFNNIENNQRQFVLIPNRSLTGRGRALFYGGLALAAGLSAYFTAQAGLWPISIAILSTAAGAMGGMALCSRSGREYERITLDGNNIEIRHHKPGFKQEKIYTLPAYMLRVETTYDKQDLCQKIILKSGKKAVQIGDFLPPIEKKEFAAALEGALKQMQTAHHLKPESQGVQTYES